MTQLPGVLTRIWHKRNVIIGEQPHYWRYHRERGKKTDKCEKEKENDKDTFAAYFQLILI